jgi:hypothetical protein
MPGPSEMINSQSRTVVVIVGIALLILLAAVLIPQSVWVNLSIKLFP